MSSYILLEANGKDYNWDYEESEEFIWKEDRGICYEECVSFCRTINKKLNLEVDHERPSTDSIHTSVIRRLRINSDVSNK